MAAQLGELQAIGNPVPKLSLTVLWSQIDAAFWP